MRPRIVPTVALLVALVLGGCGGDSTGGAAGVDLSREDFTVVTGTAAVSVDATDNKFAPRYLEVDAGTTITFVNRGRNDHNVLPVVDHAFSPVETDDFRRGDEMSIRFEEPGDYPYYCSLHGTTTKGMVGAVRVVAPG